MKRLIAYLLVICLALAAGAGAAEQGTAEECAGDWYLVYADVTIGELALNGDRSYLMTVYSQDAVITGSWSMEEYTVTLAPQDGSPSSYLYDGTELIPEIYDSGFSVRREPGRITDRQLNDYAETQILPDGISEEDMDEIIQGIYDASSQDTATAETLRDFAGVWENDAGGYLTIWGEYITAAFPIDGQIQTGYYGNPGEWSRDGNTLFNKDGTILIKRSSGDLLCSEGSGIYLFRRVFDPSDIETGAAADRFAGAWQGIGVMITDDSGVKVFAPIAGYDLEVREDLIRTLFDNGTGAYPYEIHPESGALSFTDEENETIEYVLYRDGMLRWTLSDKLTVVFRKADAAEAAAQGDEGETAALAGSETNEPDGEAPGSADGQPEDSVTGSASQDAGGEEENEGSAGDGTETTADAGGNPEGVTTGSAGADASEGGALDGAAFDTLTRSWSRGFSVPVITSLGEPVKKENKAKGTISWHYKKDGIILDENCSFIRLDFFPETEEDYRTVIGENIKEELKDPEEKVVYIDGVPVYLIRTGAENGENGPDTVGFIYAVRENTLLEMSVSCSGTEENPRRIAMADLETLASRIAFDPEKAPVRKADGELSISFRDNPVTAVSAGKSVAFTAKFANASAVKGDSAGALVWTVTDPDTGEVPEGITVNEKGVLSVDWSITEQKDVEVTVSSAVFGTKASCGITAVPAIRKLGAEPQAIEMYMNSGDSATVRILPEPAFIPEGLEWTVSPRKIAEVIPGADGTATVKALEAGKGTLTVKEPGGKTATVKVSVVQPVESIQLSATGRPLRGGTVKMAASLKPGNAGNRKVTWSLDVGKDIATINEYGRLRITGEAPVGTVITVTCTALGAKEPVVETMQITVEGKQP